MGVPSETAVLVIDVQAGFFYAKTPPLEAEAVLARINRLTSRARKAGALVILVQHDGEPGTELVRPFTPGWRLAPGLEVEKGDLVLRKTTCDAFYRTSLETELRTRKIKTLVLTGYATEFCMDATLRNAASKDFELIVASDAHTTNDNAELPAEANRRLHNWIWANSSTAKSVRVVKASSVDFGSGAGA
jgi:nicotinamidase-related amidase